MKFPTTLVLLPAVVYAQPNNITCPNAPVDADCETCLSAGCVTTVGECISNCMFIADAPCYAVRDSTVEEVCATKAAMEADQAICADETVQGDCGTCTSTLKSDGVSTCQWYTPVGAQAYCGTGGCNMMGVCGSDVCDAGAGGPCTGFPSCEPCLNSRLECAWIAGRCEASCDAIMDIACYHPSNFPNMTGPEICAIAEDADPIIMGPPEEQDITDEEEATELDNTDGGGRHPCNGFELCEPCLNSRIECAWIAGRCEPSCDAIMDVACYHPANFPNMTGPEICAIADSAEPMIMGPPDGMMNETSMEDLPMEESADDMSETSDGPETPDEEDGEVATLESISGAMRMSQVLSMVGIVSISVAAIAFL